MFLKVIREKILFISFYYYRCTWCAIFTYILYSEGAFETKLESKHYKPFEMKCEAGKCGAGKCGGTK